MRKDIKNQEQWREEFHVLCEAFFETLAEGYDGVEFEHNGKKYWISVIPMFDFPDELSKNYQFFQMSAHNHSPDPQLIRAFKDKFDLMENFKIDGKCLRQLVIDCDIKLTDYNL